MQHGRLTLVIGSKNLSSWSLRPWLLMRQLEMPFEEIVLPLDTPEFQARIDEYSPTRRVPVLIDGTCTVWDSLAICEYVNELASGAGWPREREARAHARAIAAEMHSGFEALRSEWVFYAAARANVELSNAARQDVARIEEIWTQCRDRYATSGPWLFGDFSIADAMYAPVALRFATYGAKLSGVCTGYVEQVLANAHVQSWIEGARLETGSNQSA